MCGRFQLTAASQEIVDFFALRKVPRYEKCYNIPPGQKILSVVQLDDGSRKGVYLFWGLIPSWSKDKKISSHLINARSETLAEKPSFRSAYKKRRCLIPANGFFEWQNTASGKQAYHIHAKDNALFAFAGLWEHWQHENETIYSCTIITRAANTFMQTIHHRMPVIIAPSDYELWLNKQTADSELAALLNSDAYQNIVYDQISNRINSPTHNDAQCLIPN